MSEQPKPSQSPLSLRHWARQHWEWVVAVIVGNLLYFLVLYPWLPAQARHRRNQVDLGLLVDLWLCFFIFGLLKFTYRRRKER